MEQNITVEQMEALLRELTKPSRKQVLEDTVQKRTPHYVNLNNPQHDQELMEAYLELATIYGTDGDIGQAHSNFKAAKNEFANMCRVETQQPQYIMGGKEGFQRFREQKRANERQLEGFKFRLVQVADKIGYDSMSLMFIPTTDNPKSNLVEKIMDYAA